MHQYRHYRSSHTDHIKKSIIYSQGLRVNRLCWLEKDFIDQTHEMKSRFQKIRLFSKYDQ